MQMCGMAQKGACTHSRQGGQDGVGRIEQRWSGESWQGCRSWCQAGGCPSASCLCKHGGAAICTGSNARMGCLKVGGQKGLHLHRVLPQGLPAAEGARCKVGHSLYLLQRSRFNMHGSYDDKHGLPALVGISRALVYAAHL